MKIYGTHDDATLAQLRRCVGAEEGARGVLCADGHKGYSMPIGGVVAYRKFVSPSGVGYDIACGNMAVRTNLKTHDVSPTEMTRIADAIQQRISFGIGRVNEEPVDHPVLAKIAASPVYEQSKLWHLASQQLGTVGSGNHYVDVLEERDTDPRESHLWVAVHFGSRGFGHKTATMFMNVAKGLPIDAQSHEGEMDAPPLLLDASMPSGQDYLAAMQLAGQYAYAGRELVVQRVLQIMGAQATDTVHNHHNFTWRERHFDEYLWVVRKGATPAFPGQRGFVGGSMGDFSVILSGVACDEAADALSSVMHGAGRIMSRRQAAGKTRVVSRWKCQNRDCDYTAAKGGYFKEEGGRTPTCPTCGHKLRLTPMVEQLKPGAIDFGHVKKAIYNQGIILRGGGADESPDVYRQLSEVLDAHKNTIQIHRWLAPRAVVMAGSDCYDPYKD